MCLFQSHWHSYRGGPLSAALPASTLERLPARCWNQDAGMYFYFRRGASVRSIAYAGRWALAHSPFQINSRGVQWDSCHDLWRPVKFFSLTFLCSQWLCNTETKKGPVLLKNVGFRRLHGCILDCINFSVMVNTLLTGSVCPCACGHVVYIRAWESRGNDSLSSVISRSRCLSTDLQQL